jgi:uncharacterized protein (DUF3820 family)
MAKSLWILPFGKYSGQPIEDIEDVNYLEWLLEQDWFVNKFGDGVVAIEKELKFRETFGNK